MPDRIVLMPGEKIYFVEMKRPGGKTSTSQDRQIAFIQKLGFKAYVISSEEELEKFIKILKEE